MKYKIYNEEAVEWAKHYDKKKFHALLCDPPYHLSSIVKRFGKDGSAPAQYGTDGAFSRASAGFMGKTWDGGDVAFDPDTWAAFGELLYPGAFGMAFSASRNWHRLAVAIEDAGFIIHPTIFGWAYGSGFPKATRVKSSDACPECSGSGVIRKDYTFDADAETHDATWESFEWEEVPCPTCNGEKKIVDGDVEKIFAGHRYGLQALKPALEPIIVFQRPYEGRPIENITSTGAGVLNVDGGRVGVTDADKRDIGRVLNRSVRPAGDGWGMNDEHPDNPTQISASGRWPANFLLLDDAAANALDRQSGIQRGGFVRNRTDGARVFNNNGKDTDYHTDEVIDEPDAGASRFFFRVREQLDEADPVKYQAKASRSERNAGLEGFDERRGSADYRPNDDGTAGIQSRLHGATIKGHNPHPTVKPLALAKYLATLLLPPVEYAPRRILVPFSGVGSEMIGAGQAGWEQVVGVEFDTESNYVEIAKARIDYWCGDENPSV